MDTVKQENGVVHLVIKSTEQNFFYGNMKALFENQEALENNGSLKFDTIIRRTTFSQRNLLHPRTISV